ncbi:MAG TPA: Fe-S cluster assembly protein SufD [Vicinamibacterales bacterium]|jgi:Fe-S cluster assembly protein SufD
MPDVTLKSPTAAGHVVALFERLEGQRSAEPAWLRTRRRNAMIAFEHLGFPTTRDEEWRFTNIKPIAGARFSPAPSVTAVSSQAAAGYLIPGIDGSVLTFVNGRFAPALSSLRPGVRLGSMAELLRSDATILERHLGRYASTADRAFVALNTALFEDGAVIDVEPDTVVGAPVQLVFLSADNGTPIASHPRVLIVAGRNSQVRVIESFGGVDGGARTFTNAVTEIVTEAGAVVEHYRLQRERDESFHIGHTQFQLGRSSNSTSHAVSIGGLIARHEAVAVLADEGVECTLNGLYLADGSRLVDNHTEIDHAMPHGGSHELYKGILAGQARAVFNGRIRVRPDAQKTDAKQTNKTLLLSDDAQINTKPQLEILANDVKCTHGATVGQLSEDAMFYLRARGIGADEARGLLIRAFAIDVVNRMSLEPVRAELDRLLASWLPGALAREVVA